MRQTVPVEALERTTPVTAAGDRLVMAGQGAAEWVSPQVGLQQAPLVYLINQYPAVTHTFIRREIAALESRGHAILRVSLQAGSGLVDPEDRTEWARTTRLLERPGRLVFDLVSMAAARPMNFLKATLLTLRLMRRSDRSPLRHLASLIEACGVARLMHKSKARHIHAHFGTNPAQIAMLAAALTGGSYSFTVHGYDEYDRPQFLALTLKISRATFVAAVSHYGRSQLLRWCDKADRGKIELVRCGLDAAALHAPLPNAPMAANRFVCVARLCREKAQETLLLALAQLISRNRQAELVLVGDGSTRPQLEAMIAELGLAQHVRLTGWLAGDRVRSEISAARALVVPSFAENLPVVIMEAMALGKPVIATAIAGIPELVINGETGWLVPASSVGMLADAMEACLDSPEQHLSDMGARGQTRVRRDHSVFDEAGKLSRLFCS